MALLGASIALFAYTKIIEKPAVIVSKDSSRVEVQDAKAFLTSFQMQEGQVDFTYAAEQTVHAVVHVHTKSMMGMQPDNPIMEWFYGDRYSTDQGKLAVMDQELLFQLMVILLPIIMLLKMLKQLRLN